LYVCNAGLTPGWATQLYLNLSGQRQEMERRLLSSRTTRDSVSLDALVKPMHVVNNQNGKSPVGAMLFVCGDHGDCLGYWALTKPNETTERTAELKLLYNRLLEMGLPVRARINCLLEQAMHAKCCYIVYCDRISMSARWVAVVVLLEFNNKSRHLGVTWMQSMESLIAHCAHLSRSMLPVNKCHDSPASIKQTSMHELRNLPGATCC